MKSENLEPKEIPVEEWIKRTLDEIQEMYPYEYHQAASELFGELGYEVQKVKQ